MGGSPWHPRSAVAPDVAADQLDQVAAPSGLPQPEPRSELSKSSPYPSTQPDWHARRQVEVSAFGHLDKEARTGLSLTFNRVMTALCGLDGFNAAAIFSLERGMIQRHVEAEGMELEEVAAAGAEILQLQRRTLQRLGQRDSVEEMVMTLKHHHLIFRPSTRYPQLLIVAVLDRTRANLGGACFTLSEAISWLEA